MAIQTEQEAKRTPTRGCYAAADYFVDFETLDGVSSAFKESLENFPSEMDAVSAVARHINNATRAAEMLDALRAVAADIDNPHPHDGIRIRPGTREKVRNLLDDLGRE